MKKLLYIFVFLLIISCDSSDSEGALPVETPNETMVLDATGTLAEETIEEAKKIIFGRWNLSNNAVGGGLRPAIVTTSIVANSTSCEFEFIEFTDDDYILEFDLDGESIAAFGSYVLNEDSDGFVTSVDLYYEVEGLDIIIATLTDIIVTEQNNEFTATFTIELQIPDSFEICNNLEGTYNGQKEEPMDETNSADANSNHFRLLKTWTLVSIIEEGGNDITSDFTDDICLVYNEATGVDDYIVGCTPTTKLTLTFSTYGTYTFVETGSSEGTYVDTDTWEWSDESQTAFYVGELDELFLITIESLNESDVVFSAEEDGKKLFYTFSIL